jgi:hypothetical protein
MDALTCAQVEEGDLEARYLAGTVSPEEAEAYEAHYFGCARCWEALQRALEARSAFAPRRARRWRPSLPLAAAATIILVAVGVWQLGSGPASAPDTLRGSADSVAVTVGATARTLTASWSRVAGAESYRARLFAADGGLLADRETADTSLVIRADSLPRALRVVYWKVEALGPSRAEIASSGLRRVAVPHQ